MNTSHREPNVGAPGHEPGFDDDDEGLSLLDIAVVLAENVKLLIIGPLVIGMAALGITYLIAPTFTARTTFLPPQQQQSSAASALASLGALSGLAGLGGGLKSPAEQYVSLLQSVSVTDRLIDEFKLMVAYKADYRFEARKELARNVRITLGRKDGLITIEVDDTNPQRAADLANRHVEELRRMTNVLSVTEAQQRRAFFEQELERSRGRLITAQQALQASGFNQGALRAEPKAAAESYARLKAQITSAEVRLQTMRSYLNENAPEFQQQQSMLAALRVQLSRAEQATDPQGGPDYVSKYRDFKYEEALFELFARQYELARLDEAREGALVQIVDAAQKPEWKSKPKRATAAAISALVTLALVLAYLFIRHALRRAVQDPVAAQRLAAVRAALRKDANT